MAARPIPTVAELQKYATQRNGQLEAVRQSLYDFQTYAQAGQTQLSFFQVPVGQSSKTQADTNMTIAGSLPNPQKFLVESIEIVFLPGVLPSVGPQADDESIFVNDVWRVMKTGGWLNFTIGSKPYLTEAPLMRFPPKARLDGFAAAATNLTTGAATQTLVAYASSCGRPYMMDPPLLLEPTMNFSVTLNWPTAVALDAGDTTAKIGVILDGVLYRAAQ